MQERIRLKLVREQQRQTGIQKIKAKHITEFANEQLQDFAAVLGLPEVSLQDLANKREQMEPLITDTLRERAYFARQLEGYPNPFSQNKEFGSTLGLHNDSLLDFYESLSILPKVSAALYQAFMELIQVNKPETGLAISALEMELFKEGR
jgi:hypothetical protein